MRYAVAFILALLIFGIASAQEIGTSQENACNEGGLFFRDGMSLCETEWHWECGWYIANGQNTGEVVPDWCGTYGTPPPELECFAVSPSVYIKFGLSPTLPPGAMTYVDADCATLGALIFSVWFVYSESHSEAFDICTDTPGALNWAVVTDTPNLYRCSLF